MTDIVTMLRNQVQATLTNSLDAAVQAGDIAAARNATKQIAELAMSTVPAPAKGPAFTNADIRQALKTKAPWFGTDPRRSAKAVEFGKNMEPESFATADLFADAVIKAVDDEFKPKTDDPADGEEDEDTDKDDTKSADEKPTRKKTDAPSGDTGRSAARGKSTGPWTKLFDAPKEIADQVKASADKFTRNATKEAREKFIITALGTAYAADQRKKGAK